MTAGEWTRGPFGLDGGRGRTLRHRRTVLAIAHNVTAGTRLGDVVPLIEEDQRIQVVFTHPPSSVLSAGTSEFLGRLGGVVIPWQQATQIRFDLALAASAGQLERVHAPVVSMPHGIGLNKYPARWTMPGPGAPREVAGTERSRFVWHGRVTMSALLLPTQRQVERLRRSCPEAAAIATVTGDPCYDRLAASMPSRERYRRALGTGDRKLVAVSSTWGPGSLLNRQPGLIADLVRRLPADRYQVAAIVHPSAWAWHSTRQLHAWLADALRHGLILVPPEEGWRAVLAAADVVVGDHGSVTCYSAAAGTPVLLASFPAAEIEPGCTVTAVGKIARRLRPGQPYAAQLARGIAAWSPQRHEAIRALVTDIPGGSAAAIRTVLYRLLKLPEPPTGPRPHPVPLPRPAALAESFGGPG
jgi:hypothetical protein